jgi:hypothetical protein
VSPRTIRIHGRTRLLPPLSVRLSEAERAEVERRAKQVGLAVSEFARRAMLGSHLRSQASRLVLREEGPPYAAPAAKPEPKAEKGKPPRR